ncbi:MAG TPA: hypothetical protein VFA18_22250 [Gemmataceae bacterium]|nr:hypothetical protein [Gemmataceae bacterium]
MARARVLVACLALLLLVGLAPAAGLPLGSATGTVVSANSSTIIIRPRNAEGQFGSALTLKVRGTTHITTLTTRRQGGQVVLVQNETDAGSVRKNQVIAVIYTTTGSDRVLVSAVVTPAGR